MLLFINFHESAVTERLSHRGKTLNFFLLDLSTQLADLGEKLPQKRGGEKTVTDPFLPGECYASQEREHYLCLSAPRRVKTGHIMSYTHLPPFKNRTFVSIQMERKSSIKERTELALDKLWRISFQAPAPAVRWGQPRGRMNGAWVSLSPALGGRQLGRARHCATGKNTLITDLSSLANPSSSASTAPLITFFIPLSPFTTEGGGGESTAVVKSHQ